MRTLFVTGYLFMVAVNIIAGTFTGFGLPLNDGVGTIFAFSLGFIGFERLCKLVGVYK